MAATTLPFPFSLRPSWLALIGWQSVCPQLLTSIRHDTALCRQGVAQQHAGPLFILPLSYPVKLTSQYHSIAGASALLKNYKYQCFDISFVKALTVLFM